MRRYDGSLMDVRVCGGEWKSVACRRRLITAVLVAALALALAASATASAASSRAAYRVQRLCGTPPPGYAACTGMRLVPASLTSTELSASAARQAGEASSGATPAVTYKQPWPGFLTPQSLHAAYSLPSEPDSATLQTVAVIDAFDDPTAEADLEVYDHQFGLPACTAANGCFRKINQEGNASPLPAKEGEWAGEISIDVQMAHAVCPNCRVLLVEADNDSFANLGASVNAAVNAGATEISNSYAGPEVTEFASEFSEYNTLYYDHPGLVVTASSGDCGYLNSACGKPTTANFPADSPDVVGVGGTSLTVSEETWASTVWADGGSGCSEIFLAPLWQSGASGFSATGCGDARSVADVAAIGDPETGVDVYDSTPEGKGDPTGWGVWGGTSVASPIIASEFGLAGGAHGVAYPGSTLYAHLGEDADLYDVVSGNNGSCGVRTECQAAVDYDGPTGVGSPIGLGAFSAPGTPASSSPPTVSGTAAVGQTLEANDGTWTNKPTSSSDQWERCNASGAGCSAIAGANGETYAVTAGDLGSTIRVQESASNDAGSGPPAASAPTALVNDDVLSLTGFTPISGITGSPVTIEGSDFDGVSAVEFGSRTAKFTILSGTQIEAIVPNGAVPGTISLSGSSGSATSTAKFTPTLSVTSFKPASGKVGKTITLKGVGFNSHPTVSFDGVTANVKSSSSTKLRVTVPAGAKAGPISVTNTSAPVGTVYSAASFKL
jgi:hypothetical protein